VDFGWLPDDETILHKLLFWPLLVQGAESKTRLSDFLEQQKASFPVDVIAK